MYVCMYDAHIYSDTLDYEAHMYDAFIHEDDFKTMNEYEILTIWSDTESMESEMDFAST